MEIVRIAAGTSQTAPPETIGAKAANLARMAALGLPVPPAFVLPIAMCEAIVAGEASAHRRVSAALAEGLEFLEQATGNRFGDRRRPLLVSVRSGAARSMPGMLDTVLDVGCTGAAVDGLVRMTGNPRFAWDCRSRFIESYADVVLGLDASPLAGAAARLVAAESVRSRQDLDSEALERMALSWAALVEDAGASLPEDPVAQLEAAARAVYRSWMSPRAVTYRRLERLEHLAGTAVTVQVMVYGNRGPRSGSGVAFSRDPSTGRPEPLIDVMFEAQGEDVVSGSHTPQTEAALERQAPAAAAELRAALTRLEGDFRDVQDVEFTIEEGRLWLLQTRSAKRTPRAALRIAVDMVADGLISPEEALVRLEGVDTSMLVETRLADAGAPAAAGTGASAGVAVGRAAFDTDGAERLAASGDPVILVRPDTSTADVAGFAAAAGIVTAVGGRTAHAALVARQMGRPCVVGCTALEVDPDARRARLGECSVAEGDWLSIDGASGAVHVARGRRVVERPESDLAEVARWRAMAGHGPARVAAEGC